MDVCVPSGRPGSAFCTHSTSSSCSGKSSASASEAGVRTRVRPQGKAARRGSGPMRAAVLSGEPVAESPLAVALSSGTPAPARAAERRGPRRPRRVASLPALAGPSPSSSLRRKHCGGEDGARAARIRGGGILLLSITVGYVLVRRMLAALELEERFRTAGRIAAGVTHDLGHRSPSCARSSSSRR